MSAFALITCAIREEWERSTTIGRVIWVPLLAILLPVCFLLRFVLMIPLFALAWLLEAPISKCLTGLRRVLFKQPSADQAQEEVTPTSAKNKATSALPEDNRDET